MKITGRHVEVTAALKQYIEARTKRLEHYGPKLSPIQVILGVEKFRHTAEVVLTLNGAVIQAKTSTKDLYASIDQSFDKINSQMRKHKEKLVARKAARGSALRTPLIEREPEPKSASIKISRPSLRRLTIADAVESLGEKPSSFVVFVNATSNRVQVVRRSEQGTVELIDPQPA